MILECKMNQAYPSLDFSIIDMIIAYGDQPYCDYQWVLDLRQQCIQQHCLFLFLSTGPVLIKDGKSYSIPDHLQIQQAQKAQIDYFPHQDLFQRLAHSKFRSSFTLRKKERDYLHQKGWKIIDQHAGDFIETRLAPMHPYHDGAQTPMKGHPVFLAQHATGCCCRGCLEKWHHIPKEKELSQEEQHYIVSIIMEWIARQDRT